MHGSNFRAIHSSLSVYHLSVSVFFFLLPFPKAKRHRVILLMINLRLAKDKPNCLFFSSFPLMSVFPLSFPSIASGAWPWYGGRHLNARQILAIAVGLQLCPVFLWFFFHFLSDRFCLDIPVTPTSYIFFHSFNFLF